MAGRPRCLRIEALVPASTVPMSTMTATLLSFLLLALYFFQDDNPLERR
jgi:hypothetical protein